MAEQYNSNFTGPEIDAILGGAVRYDLAQSLTTAQQTQARSNIAAAPGGYGLGGNAKNLTADDNIDDCKTTGWYMWDWNPANQPAGLPNAAKYHVGLMRVEAATVGSGDACQTIYFPKSTGTDNTGDQCTIQRMGVISGAWNPFEWINPPLALGVEYRTTERYLGKPVYCKLVNCGEIAGDKTVAHGISSMSRCIFAQGNYLGAILPMIVNRSLSDTRTVYISSVSNTAITIICGANITGGTCYVQVKYTKTTD